MPEEVKVTKTSALAIWSLILGIFSFMCLGLLAGVPSVICGLMAISKINAAGGSLQGKGLAIGGLITGAMGTVFTTLAYAGIIAGIMLPSIATARNRAQRVHCANNLQQIDKASMIYAMDNDDQRPSNFQALRPYVGDDSLSIFVCPATASVPGDVLNIDEWTDYSIVPGLRESSPMDSVFAYSRPECYPEGGGNVLLLDGYVQWYDPIKYAELIASFNMKE